MLFGFYSSALQIMHTYTSSKPKIRPQISFLKQSIGHPTASHTQKPFLQSSLTIFPTFWLSGTQLLAPSTEGLEVQCQSLGQIPHCKLHFSVPCSQQPDTIEAGGLVP